MKTSDKIDDIINNPEILDMPIECDVTLADGTVREVRVTVGDLILFYLNTVYPQGVNRLS